jgi:hypothetical protein
VTAEAPHTTKQPKQPRFVLRSYTVEPEVWEQLKAASHRYDLSMVQIIRRGIRRELAALAEQQEHA